MGVNGAMRAGIDQVALFVAERPAVEIAIDQIGSRKRPQAFKKNQRSRADPGKLRRKLCVVCVRSSTTSTTNAVPAPTSTVSIASALWTRLPCPGEAGRDRL